VRTFLAPRFWGVHLLALVCVVAAGWLGAWQYGGWQERRAAEAADLTQLDPVPLEKVMGPDDPFPGDMVGHPVRVDGTWVLDGTVFVSGREHDGRSGYWVVTPLALAGPGTPAIPVVRGWVPSPEAAPQAPTGSTSLVGGLQPPDGSTTADEDPDDDVLPQLRIADLIQHVDQDLYGAYVVADAPADGLERADLEQLPDAGSFTALRNLLYALEWWVFGAFAIFIWWRHLRDSVQREDAAEDPVPSDA
jgi:surfeit locus 1 family protein